MRAEAAAAVQGVPGATVRKVSGSPVQGHTSGVSTTRAYVVFIGDRPGVYETWYDFGCPLPHSILIQINFTRGACQESNISLTIHKSYPSAAHANAAFEFAFKCGWVSNGPFPDRKQLPIPVYPSAAPTPEINALHDKYWYNVYQGITPGVYQSQQVLLPISYGYCSPPCSLEASLHTNGISKNVHEKICTEDEAKRDFDDAVQRGAVRALTPPSIA